MRFPNLRYGNPTEFAYYAMGRPVDQLARALRRDERTIRDWLSGRARVPWWVPEIMRLKRLELEMRQREMFWALAEKPRLAKLGMVAASGTLQLLRPKKQKPQSEDVRLSQDAASNISPSLRSRS